MHHAPRRTPSLHTRISQRRRGFTLVEVLLVLAILGVIAAIVIPNLLGTGEKANIRAAKLNINEIENLALLYAQDNNNRLPESLSALTEPYEVDGVEVEPVTDKIAKDPWGAEFNYEVGEGGRGSHQKIKKPDIWSNGPDGENDNGSGDDINNWSDLEE